MSSVYQGLQTNVTAPLTATIIGATDPATPIVIQTSAAHNFQTGDQVWITGVGGNTAANAPRSNPWTIVVVDATHFSLTGSTANGAYTSGGVATDMSATPATTIPSDGDNRNAASVNTPLETALDRTQYIVPRMGRYRFIDQYILQNNDDSFGTWSTTANSTVGSATVSTTTGNGVSPITITTTAAHGFVVGQMVRVNGVGGNTAANGTWVVQSVPLTTTFTIAATGNGAYTSGGACTASWGPCGSASALLTFPTGTPTPVCNANDMFDIFLSTTATTSAAANQAKVGLGFTVGSPGNLALVSGSAIELAVSYTGLLSLRGTVSVGSASTPAGIGAVNQPFNVGVMDFAYASSPPTLTLIGYYELIVNHYRLIA